jgi:ribonuclease HII
MKKAKEKILKIGIDEVGRGALAGPVVASALYLKTPSFSKLKVFKKLKDSKKLSPRKRKEIYTFLKKSKEVDWATAKIMPSIIDKMNIFQATKLAMKKAAEKLLIQLSQEFKPSKIVLLIDGNFKIDLDIAQKTFIKGDERIFLIKLASIVAKVERDRIMVNYHKKFPLYNFPRHKGYGTKEHFLAIKKYGACKIHRKSFAPFS